MFVKVTKRQGKEYIQIIKKYRDANGKAKDKTVLTPGFVDKYIGVYDDPIAHFKKEAQRMSQEEEENYNFSLQINLNDKLLDDESNIYNVGYVVLKRLYRSLKLDEFFKKESKNLKIKYDLNKIYELLVFSRILFPASKRKTLSESNKLFEDYSDISLDDIYSALDIFSSLDDKIQEWIFIHSKDICERDLSLGYFDCTNFYYDISRPDETVLNDNGEVEKIGYRKYGPEKNHRKDPIVEMGLLMDNKSIPISYSIFPGNESEKVHMLPIVKSVRSKYNIERIIIVADRGLNTSDNIYKLNGDNKTDNNSLDGYVYGQSVRIADKEFKEWVLKKDDYIKTKITDKETDDDTVDDNLVFIHKSRIYPKSIAVDYVNKKGKTVKRKVTVDQKQLVYYSSKYAKKQKLDRQRSIDRAIDLIAHPKKYDKAAAKGASGYVLNIAFDKDSGEVIAKNLSLDEEKIKEEEKYDGYYSIVTSELNMDDLKIREIYRGLIKIEDSFRITKTDFHSRPAYVFTDSHIEAHFQTCFTSLVLIRLLENKLNNKYIPSQILDSLRKCNCVHIKENVYQFIYSDEIIKEIEETFLVDLTTKYRKRDNIRRLLKY